jgi:hypothetical protein
MVDEVALSAGDEVDVCRELVAKGYDGERCLIVTDASCEWQQFERDLIRPAPELQGQGHELHPARERVTYRGRAPQLTGRPRGEQRRRDHRRPVLERLWLELHDARATPTARAPASSTRAGATSAAPPSSAATSTAGSAAQPTLPLFTGPRHTPDPMLAIPKPTTRAECLQEARPCPWASCRHHLLLEVAASKGGDDVRATTLRLNRPRQLHGLPLGRTGRRSGLAATAAHHVVEQWIDDAVELLQGMRYTCALDIADVYPDGITERSVGLVLGVSEKAARADIELARDRLRAGLVEIERMRRLPSDG